MKILKLNIEKLIKCFFIGFFVFISFYTHFVFSDSSCKHNANNFRCVQYVDNYDGDTITFNIPKIHTLIGSNIKIRVSGIDTPEIRTKNKCEKEKAIKAKKMVFNLLSKAQKIHLENVQRGKYFRIVADVKADGVSVGEYLKKVKLAQAYFGGRKNPINWCSF